MSTPGPSAPPTKRAAPINSTAFTFSLDTPKAKRPRPLGDFAPGLSSHSLTPAAKAESSASYNPKVTVKPENSALSTPRKVYQSLDALPSPFALRTPAQPRPSHRLNEILDEVSPFRRGEDEKPGERVRLGDLPGQRLTEDVNMGEARRRVVEEDEGIGVSPRRGKNGLRWSGKGYVSAQ